MCLQCELCFQIRLRIDSLRQAPDSGGSKTMGRQSKYLLDSSREFHIVSGKMARVTMGKGYARN